MATYCVNRNAQDNGDHEVHNVTAGCGFLPEHRNRVDLGEHPDCRSAVREAGRYFTPVDGCAYCAPSCHRS